MSRPYFETEVVKVGKKKKIGSPILIGSHCPMCGAKTENKKPKGNWVNGENLDKIKFPCFCSFNYGGKKCYGEININYNEDRMESEYELSNITQQVDGKKMGNKYSVIYSDFSLKELIKVHDIHIRKGKIIIFEEE